MAATRATNKRALDDLFDDMDQAQETQQEEQHRAKQQTLELTYSDDIDEISSVGDTSVQTEVVTTVIHQEELWKSAASEGFSRFQVSTLGRVRNITTGNTLDGYVTPAGYSGYYLRSDTGKSRQMLVHRLVALLFLPHIEGKLIVNHKNHNRTDSRLENLEWVTARENSVHANHPVTVAKNKRQITRITIDNILTQYTSVREASKQTDICETILYRHLKTGKNYKDAKFVYTQSIQPTNTDEEWRELVVDGGPVTCYVSSLGRIKSKHGRILDGNSSGGYRIVHLNGHNYTVHRLVAKAFLGLSPSAQHTVDHINQNKADNRAINLRFASRVEQSNNRSNSVRIQKINAGNNQIVAIYSSYPAAALAENKHRSTIRGRCQRGTVVDGFKWIALPSSCAPGTQVSE